MATKSELDASLIHALTATCVEKDMKCSVKVEDLLILTTQRRVNTRPWAKRVISLETKKLKTSVDIQDHKLFTNISSSRSQTLFHLIKLVQSCALVSPCLSHFATMECNKLIKMESLNVLVLLDLEVLELWE